MLTSNETDSDNERAERLTVKATPESLTGVRFAASARGRVREIGPASIHPAEGGRHRAGWTTENGTGISGRDMDARTKSGEFARNGPRAERWRPVPWEVISIMLTMVMVGAVVGGLTLAALCEVREDLRALGTRVTALEQRVAALERGQARLEGLIEGLREAMRERPPASG